MIVFVTFAIVGWEESNYLCNRKKQSQTEPQKPHPRPSLTPSPSPKGEGSRMKSEMVILLNPKKSLTSKNP